MTIQGARRAVVGRAASDLMRVDVGSRCRAVGLPPPRESDLRIRAFGNDLGLRARNLSPYERQPFDGGDFGARNHAIGPLEVTLVYHCGDEEISPTAEVLFDACIKCVYTTEDVVRLASRICIGLL